MRLAGVALLPWMLGGCSLELMNPQGAIGHQEKNLILVALGLMLLVVIPVIALTLFFAWHYRASNERATYTPKWAHSTKIEVVVWTIPVLIVLTLGVLIWRTTHTLDPYRPIEADRAPLRVDVVALNWKWLFIYPDYHVASVNELAIPKNTPVAFKLTAESLMNSFFIPQLGSQVYVMAGMQTQLHLISDSPGDYAGRSASYSGPGFSDMAFTAKVRDDAGFAAWIENARKSAKQLDPATLKALEAPSKGGPVTYYRDVEPELFDGIVRKYGVMHASDMHHTNAPAQAAPATEK